MNKIFADLRTRLRTVCAWLPALAFVWANAIHAGPRPNPSPSYGAYTRGNGLLAWSNTQRTAPASETAKKTGATYTWRAPKVQSGIKTDPFLGFKPNTNPGKPDADSAGRGYRPTTSALPPDYYEMKNNPGRGPGPDFPFKSEY